MIETNFLAVQQTLRRMQLVRRSYFATCKQSGDAIAKLRIDMGKTERELKDLEDSRTHLSKYRFDDESKAKCVQLGKSIEALTARHSALTSEIGELTSRMERASSIGGNAYSTLRAACKGAGLDEESFEPAVSH